MNARNASLLSPTLSVVSRRTVDGRVGSRRTPPATSDPSGFDAGVYLPIDDEPLVSRDGARGFANGNAAVAFSMPQVNGTLGAQGTLCDFGTSIAIHGALTLELKVDVAGSVSGSIALPLVALPAFTVGAFVVITPYAALNVRCSASSPASGCVSVVAPFQASVHYFHAGGPAIDLPRFAPELGAPDSATDFELFVELELSLVFLVTIDGVAVGGPSLSSAMSLAARGAALPAPAWGAHLTSELRAGWTLSPEGPRAAASVVADSWALPPRSSAGGLSPTRWSRVIALPDSEAAAGLVASAAGMTLMANSRFGGWPWLAALDACGDITWQRSLVAQPASGMVARSLIRLANGDLLAAGWSSTSTGMRVERYGGTGTPVWARMMHGPAAALVRWSASAATVSGGAVLGGHVRHVGAGTQRCVFAEIDASGNLRWMTEIDLGVGVLDSNISALVLGPTGAILAAGTVHLAGAAALPDSVLGQKCGLVLRLFGDGSAECALAVGGAREDAVMALAQFPDGGYAIGGYAVPASGSGLERAWIACLTAEHTVRWSGTYAGSSNEPYGHVKALAALPGGGLFAVGGAGHPQQTREAWLFRTDDVGMPVWFKTLSGPRKDTLSHVVALDDGLLAFGYTTSLDTSPAPQNDLWVVRTNCDGMIHFSERSGLCARNDAAHWKMYEPVIRRLEATNVAVALTTTPAPLDLAAASGSVEDLTE